MKINSIRFRTTLLYSGILLAILIIYSGAIYSLVRTILIKGIDEQLKIKAAEIADVIAAYEKINEVPEHPFGLLEQLLQKNGFLPGKKLLVDDLWRSKFQTLRLKEDYIKILNAAGQPVIQSINITRELGFILSNKFGYLNTKIYFMTLENGLSKLRVINFPHSYKGKSQLIIQIATPLKQVYRFLGEYVLIAVFCMIAVIIFTSFLGSFFVRRILNPVVTVTKTANNITHKDLTVRIPKQTTDEEMKQLINSFNSMIERLENSFGHINEFNSYVAHELKTPLAIVKGELELAIEQLKHEDENRKILQGCLEEVDRMIKITKDLLLLAKLDYKPQILKFERIDFGMFFEEISQHCTMLASEKQIKVVSDYPKENLFVSADKVHLRRLFLNIIINAVKYTLEGGKISLSAKQEGRNLYIDISDTGEGISEENLPKIFNKFFRVDKGDKAQESGVGLGLSIALSIAKAHQAEITVKSQLNKGTTFTVIIPLADNTIHS